MPLAADRRIKILERVAEGMSIQVADLARDYGCSEMTIRRDIQRLERDGFLRRTYGGATAHLTRSLDVAFNARALANAREKRLIALEATRRIDDALMLFVGIGTTAEQFARYLPARSEVTVVTGSLPIASLLGTRLSRAVVLGGSVRRDELSCVGPSARATLERYRFDLAVLGTAGLTARWGLTDINDDEAEVHRIAVERSARLMVIADGSKLGLVASSMVAPASSIHILVTDLSAPEGELEALRALGMEIVVASPGSQRHEEQADAGPASGTDISSPNGQETMEA
ncbi:MAG TPA: DeoR/GlpR family DNA-binding transcription regulator [Candidatus Limnocylindrales bacterium]|jgi:DeoR/GlpR family transcriptional regulator of sugar metabolism